MRLSRDSELRPPRLGSGLRAEEVLERRGRERPAKVISLTVVAAELSDPLALFRGLDAFGDGPQAQVPGEGDARGNDGGIVGVFAYAAHERSLELQRAHGKAPEVVEGRVARAEVVESDSNAQNAQRLERRLGARVLRDLDALGDFELYAGRRKPRPGERPRRDLDQPVVQL